MTPAEQLSTWHDFFLLAGGASATLMGLVFVSVSLASNLTIGASSARERGIFVTPIVFQFSYALAISAVSVAPWTNVRWYGGMSLLLGATATSQCIGLLRGMLVRHQKHRPVEWDYWLWNGLVPLVAALLWTGSGVAMIITRTLHIEPVAISTLTLDLMGVSTSWRLMIWMLGQRMPPPSA